MKLIDFIIGALLFNAIPHLVFAQTKSHFLGMFGYSPKGNKLYAFLQLILSISLYIYEYGMDNMLENGFLLGGLTVLILYFIFGSFLVQFYESKK